MQNPKYLSYFFFISFCVNSDDSVINIDILINHQMAVFTEQDEQPVVYNMSQSLSLLANLKPRVRVTRLVVMPAFP